MTHSFFHRFPLRLNVEGRGCSATILVVSTLFLLSSATSGWTRAEQRVDTRADLSVADPAFAPGAGPLALIDSAHNNFHTADGRYAPFAALLRNDGLRVEAGVGRFTDERLRGVGILIIVNALAAEDTEEWRLPNPSAFSPDEIAAVRRFVEGGGSLLLIADHMPFAGAAQDLGAAFGIEFDNGFATDGDQNPDIFTRENGGLADDPLTIGVRQVRTFTGTGFRARDGVRPLLRLDARWSVLLPEEAWAFSDQTPKRSGEGALQGALLEVGAGRVAVFGEAAMFTAQVTGSKRAGLGAPGAEDNKRFALNVINWLARTP